MHSTHSESSFENFSIISYKRDSEFYSSSDEDISPKEYKKNQRLVTEVDCKDRDRDHYEISKKF